MPKIARAKKSSLRSSSDVCVEVETVIGRRGSSRRVKSEEIAGLIKRTATEILECMGKHARTVYWGSKVVVGVLSFSRNIGNCANSTKPQKSYYRRGWQK